MELTLTFWTAVVLFVDSAQSDVRRVFRDRVTKQHRISLLSSDRDSRNVVVPELIKQGEGALECSTRLSLL